MSACPYFRGMKLSVGTSSQLSQSEKLTLAASGLRGSGEQDCTCKGWRFEAIPDVF